MTALPLAYEGTEALTIEEAASLAGAPPEQLRRWAFAGVGPPNVGTRWKPKFTAEGIAEWKKARYSEAQSRLYFEGW